MKSYQILVYGIAEMPLCVISEALKNLNLNEDDFCITSEIYSDGEFQVCNLCGIVQNEDKVAMLKVWIEKVKNDLNS